MGHLYTMVLFGALSEEKRHLYTLWEVFHHEKETIVPCMNGCLIEPHTDRRIHA